MGRQIVIEIAPDGATTIEAVGFTGTACEDATRALEQALGIATARTGKPEREAKVQRTVVA